MNDPKKPTRAELFKAFEAAAEAVERCAEAARETKRAASEADTALRNAVNAMHKAEDALKASMVPVPTDDVMRSAIYNSDREAKARPKGEKP